MTPEEGMDIDMAINAIIEKFDLDRIHNGVP